MKRMTLRVGVFLFMQGSCAGNSVAARHRVVPRSRQHYPSRLLCAVRQSPQVRQSFRNFTLPPHQNASEYRQIQGRSPYVIESYCTVLVYVSLNNNFICSLGFFSGQLASKIMKTGHTCVNDYFNHICVWHIERLKGSIEYSSLWWTHHKATGRHLTYGITPARRKWTRPTLTPANPSQKGWFSINLPWRDGRLSCPRWLATYRLGFPAHRLTQPNINRARRRATTLIKTNALPLSDATSIT